MGEVSTGSRPRGRWTAALAAALFALALLGGTAAAEEAPSRTEYVSHLEAICKPRALATERATKGAKADLQAGRTAVAAGKFSRATTIFGATVTQIAAVPRPPADAAALEKWFGYLDRQEAYLKRISADLHAKRLVPAQRLTARFIHNGNLANDAVLSFGFDWCSFKFSRFG
jgi:hypothetical protein